MLHGLLRQLVPAEVISFAMLGRRGAVCMRGKLVKFSSSLMGIARHTLPQAVRMASDLSPEIAACAAANLAIGTRYGEQDT
jgi:hypothetical protein